MIDIRNMRDAKVLFFGRSVRDNCKIMTSKDVSTFLFSDEWEIQILAFLVPAVKDTMLETPVFHSCTSFPSPNLDVTQN